MTDNPSVRSAWDADAPRLRDALVCHADILGFKALVRTAFARGDEETLLRQLHRTLGNAVTEVQQLAHVGPDIPARFHVKVFTDNLLLVAPLVRPGWDGGEVEFMDVARALAAYQAYLATNGFLIRGGVAAGKHHMAGDLVYGDAMLDAIGLDQGGGTPRLALADSAVRLIFKQAEAYGGGAGAPPFQHFLVDPADDRLVLNYLQIAFEHFPDAGPDHDLLGTHRDVLKRELDVPDMSHEVRAKYLWAATYHNDECEAFVRRCGSARFASRNDVDGETAAQAAAADRVRDDLIDLALRPRVASPRPVDADWLARTRARLEGDA